MVDIVYACHFQDDCLQIRTICKGYSACYVGGIYTASMAAFKKCLDDCDSGALDETSDMRHDAFHNFLEIFFAEAVEDFDYDVGGDFVACI